MLFIAVLNLALLYLAFQVAIFYIKFVKAPNLLERGFHAFIYMNTMVEKNTICFMQFWYIYIYTTSHHGKKNMVWLSS